MESSRERERAPPRDRGLGEYEAAFEEGRGRATSTPHTRARHAPTVPQARVVSDRTRRGISPGRERAGWFERGEGLYEDMRGQAGGERRWSSNGEREGNSCGERRGELFWARGGSQHGSNDDRGREKYNDRWERLGDSYAERRGLLLLAEVADKLRRKMHDDLLRPADLFRMWDRDEDGLITSDELVSGIVQLRLYPEGGVREREELFDAIEREVCSVTGSRRSGIDLSMLASWLDPHSSFRRKPLEESLTPQHSFLASSRYEEEECKETPRWSHGEGKGWSHAGRLRQQGEAWQPATPGVGSMLLELHYFLPCQSLQLDDSIRWLQVEPMPFCVDRVRRSCE